MIHLGSMFTSGGIENSRKESAMTEEGNLFDVFAKEERFDTDRFDALCI